jgi:hypothetical protein
MQGYPTLLQLSPIWLVWPARFTVTPRQLALFCQRRPATHAVRPGKLLIWSAGVNTAEREKKIGGFIVSLNLTSLASFLPFLSLTVMIIQMCVQNSDGKCDNGGERMSDSVDVSTVRSQSFPAAWPKLDPKWRQKP